MGILDTASEVELIVSLAITSPELIGFRDGMLVPLTEAAAAAVGTFTNPVDGAHYYYEGHPEGLDRWVNDAIEELYRGTWGTLPYTIMCSLREQVRTGMRSLIFPERNAWGLLLDVRRVMGTLDDIRDLTVSKHKLSWKVVPKLTTTESGTSLHLAEPNVTVRLLRPDTMAGDETPVGREAIEEIVDLVRTALLQDSVALRARQQGNEWISVLLPGDLEDRVELHELWEVAPVRLRYRYSVLLPELLPRFILRTSGLSDGAQNERPGVVLRNGNASALIRVDPIRSELHIFVLGGDADTRRVLVTMVRRALEALHEELKITAVEELELTGDSARWFSVRDLRQLEDPRAPNQRLTIAAEKTAEVDVSRELDKLEPSESRAIDRNPTSAPIPVRVFVSYAHDDERRVQPLDFSLAALELHHHLVPWSDRRLIAGDNWDLEIKRRLEEMDIFLFVASQRSLVRGYIRDTELRRAVERREAGEVEIVILMLEPCAMDEDPLLGGLQRLAPGYRSIVQARQKPVAWEQVRRDLLPVIERVRERKRQQKRSEA